MTIYKITNTVNGKIFVGMTRRTLTESFRGHVGASRNGDISPIARALNKYGRNAFTIEPIETVDIEKEDPNAVKAFWIDRLNTMVPNGYNAYSKNHGTPILTGKVSDEDL